MCYGQKNTDDFAVATLASLIPMTTFHAVLIDLLERLNVSA
jgi:hypothetical protein